MSQAVRSDEGSDAGVLCASCSILEIDRGLVARIVMAVVLVAVLRPAG